MSPTQIRTSDMTIKKLATRFSMIALALISVSSLRAQDIHSHAQAQQNQEMTQDQRSQAMTLLQIIRNSTARFQDVSVAEAEGYALQFGCVAGDSAGAMGLHFINGNLLAKGVIDPTHPPILLYEAIPGGGLRLTGADFLVFQAAWDANNPAPPQLMGQAFHLFPSPNQFGLDAFYTLHVWAWKKNPNGAFVNWHPTVNCQAFGG